MIFPRVWAVALILTGCAGGAAALDVPHSPHRAKATEKHLTEPHRTASHHAAAAKSTTAHAGATHSTSKAAPAGQARLTARGNARANARRAALHPRRHHYYERFTASSFAKGDFLADDVTAGEDPVVRQ